MRLVSLDCMACDIEMVKLSVPATDKAADERSASSSILCVSCAEKAHKARLEKAQERVVKVF